jgi:deoxyribonuclease-4
MQEGWHYELESEDAPLTINGVVYNDKLRVCFDTCHVNDAGYDLVNDYDGVFKKFDEVLGLDQIAVFHVNDSMNPLGAHKDRHANIGAGTIGFDTLYKVVHDERFLNVPKILETPWLCAEGETKKTIPPYREEIARLLR